MPYIGDVPGVRGLMLGVSIFIPHNDHHRVHGGSRVCSMG